MTPPDRPPRNRPRATARSTSRPPNLSLRALIVDAHEATRLGVVVLLRRQPWIAQCLQADGIDLAAALAARHRPEVALLDISDTGPFVAAATARLRDAHAGIAIVLTSRCSTSLPAPLRALGAAAFLPPGTASSELVTAVGAAALSLDYAPPDPSPTASLLSDRERELLALISRGATNREIAVHMHLGPVKKSASALYRKLGVRNRTEAAQRAAHLVQADVTRPSGDSQR
jgi:two-component system response regulator DesR